MARTKTQVAEAPLEKAAVRIGPSEKNAAGQGGVFADATGTTAFRCKVPDEWKERWVTVAVQDEDCQMVFGDSAVDCVYGQDSTVAAEAISTVDTTGDHYFAGTKEDIFVEGRHTHFAVEAAGTGRITIRPSSRKAP